MRLNSVIGITVPEGVSGDAVRTHMSRVHRVEISGSFGLNIVRIGQMGEQSRAHNLFRTLHALGSSMQPGAPRSTSRPGSPRSSGTCRVRRRLRSCTELDTRSG